ncbi:MAG: hypothetical protein KC501_31100 [Myxococcales bacterium]|nr:hypothetical protein [Myxococcales bacterium]
MPPQPLLSSRGLRSLVLLAALLAGLASAMLSLTFVVHLELAPWLAASLVTAVMVRWTAAIATRRPADPSDAGLRCVGWGVFMGVLNVGAAFLAAVVVDSDAGLRGLVLAPLAMLVGAPAGALLGALIGGVLIVPVTALMIAWHRQTPAALDGAAAAVGVWVAVVGVAVLLPEPSHHGYFAMWPPSSSHVSHAMHEVWIRGVGLVVALGGLALAVLALDRGAARRRFVREVAEGRWPRWRIEPAAGPCGPCLGATPEACGHALHRVERPGDGAYRAAETSWPVAQVPSRWLG